MVTLDRGLEEAASLLYLVARGKEIDEPHDRVELAIMAVERARTLLAESPETLHHEDW